MLVLGEGSAQRLAHGKVIVSTGCVNGNGHILTQGIVWYLISLCPARKSIFGGRGLTRLYSVSSLWISFRLGRYIFIASNTHKARNKLNLLSPEHSWYEDIRELAGI